jgi:DMSO/TMAO reductase YedYZ molybdopterin-dependent catalytic subunit
MGYISRGFRGKRASEREDARLPPGQYLEDRFPVLSAGPTPHTPLDEWTFAIEDETTKLGRGAGNSSGPFPARTSGPTSTASRSGRSWTTSWEGVSIDTLLDGVEHNATHVLAFSDGDYTTNLPLEDVLDGQAWVAFAYDGQPLEAEHGGPARLLVPHLYFWKSAKWVRGLRLMDHDEPGFWESYGYHIYGDPWREQRYAGD